MINNNVKKNKDPFQIVNNVKIKILKFMVRSKRVFIIFLVRQHLYSLSYDIIIYPADVLSSTIVSFKLLSKTQRILAHSSLVEWYAIYMCIIVFLFLNNQLISLFLSFYWKQRSITTSYFNYTVVVLLNIQNPSSNNHS